MFRRLVQTRCKDVVVYIDPGRMRTPRTVESYRDWQSSKPRGSLSSPIVPVITNMSEMRNMQLGGR